MHKSIQFSVIELINIRTTLNTQIDDFQELSNHLKPNTAQAIKEEITQLKRIVKKIDKFLQLESEVNYENDF